MGKLIVNVKVETSKFRMVIITQCWKSVLTIKSKGGRIIGYANKMGSLGKNYDK